MWGIEHTGVWREMREMTEDYRTSYLDERIRERCLQCNGVYAGRNSFTVRLVLIVCMDFELKLMPQHAKPQVSCIRNSRVMIEM